MKKIKITDPILTTNHLMYRDILTGEMHQRQSDFGPDLIWCGAAAEWLKKGLGVSRARPCGLVTFPIIHKDDRQLGLQGVDDRTDIEKQWIERRPLEIYSKDFSSWYQYSRQFVKTIGGNIRAEGTILEKSFRFSRCCIRCGLQKCNDGYKN